VRKVQGSVDLARMPDPMRLDLVVCQAQNNIGLARMSDPRRLDLSVIQVQDNYQSSLSMSNGVTNLPWV
jgi:hypothetical protein